ncbi:MAG TPA: phosphoribosyltransferase family protein [Actinomycetota bacterium]|nr:phosphoribosyltransferase family protein [Actinomycetota bacterium]
MIFQDRLDAGQRLAEALKEHAGPETVVLAIPRGGVIVGEVVAGTLGVPLDVVVPRKVGAPGNPELGLGAVAPGVRVLDPWLIERLGVSEDYLEREIAAEEAETVRRLQAYRGDRPSLDLTGKTAIVVDDGVATGGTAVAALRWARAQGAATVVLAVPVAPPQTIQRLSQEADEVVALATPEPFFAVGEWYRIFDQTPDDEVLAALERAAEERG